MSKRKPREDERAILLVWKRALTDMDATLKNAQTRVRQLERVVTNIRTRSGNE